MLHVAWSRRIYRDGVVRFTDGNSAQQRKKLKTATFDLNLYTKQHTNMLPFIIGYISIILIWQKHMLPDKPRLISAGHL